MGRMVTKCEDESKADRLLAWLGCFVQAPAISITEMDPDDSAASSKGPFGTSWGASLVQATGMRGQTLLKLLARVS
jgi:hypothetical protein